MKPPCFSEDCDNCPYEECCKNSRIKLRNRYKKEDKKQDGDGK